MQTNKEKQREMEALSNIRSPSLLTAPLDSQVLSKQRKHKSPHSFMVPSNISVRLSKICCTLSESEIEENPTSKSAPKSKDRMEDYNTAMKRMMRSPYEYHHDLGQFLFISFQLLFRHLLYQMLPLFDMTMMPRNVI